MKRAEKAASIAARVQKALTLSVVKGRTAFRGLVLGGLDKSDDRETREPGVLPTLTLVETAA